MKLEVVNDTELDISCDIAVNNTHYVYESNNPSVSYEINPSKGMVNIQLFKEDIWKPKNILNMFVLLLYALDFVFGNLSESSNLPFSINHNLFLTTDLDTNPKIFLSNIVKVDPDSLKLWTKYSIFQCSMVTILVFIIGVILSFIFNGWIKIVFLTGTAVLSVGMYMLLNKKRKAILKVLYMYSNSKKE